MRKSINSAINCTKPQTIDFKAIQLPTGSPLLPGLTFVYVLCIVEFFFIIQVFRLQKVIVNGTWLNGINEIQNRQTCANLRVLRREKELVYQYAPKLLPFSLREVAGSFLLSRKCIQPGVGNATVFHTVFQVNCSFCRGVTNFLVPR